MKDICIQCGLEMKVGQVGVAVVELYLDPPEPYTITYADTRECPKCRREVVCPSSAAPTIQHHDAKFAEEIAKALYLAENGKLRIIEVYERANMAPKVKCGDCGHVREKVRPVRVTLDEAMALRDAAILWLGNLQHWSGRGDVAIEAALDAVREEIGAVRKARGRHEQSHAIGDGDGGGGERHDAGGAGADAGADLLHADGLAR